MMGYSNYDTWQAGKNNGALKKYRCHGFRIVSVCGWYILQKSMVLSRVGSIMEYVGIITELF